MTFKLVSWSYWLPSDAVFTQLTHLLGLFLDSVMISVFGQQYFLMICCGQKLGIWITLKSKPLNKPVFPLLPAPLQCGSSPSPTVLCWRTAFHCSCQWEIQDWALALLLSNYDFSPWALVKFRYLTQRWSSWSLPIHSLLQRFSEIMSERGNVWMVVVQRRYPCCWARCLARVVL